MLPPPNSPVTSSGPIPCHGPSSQIGLMEAHPLHHITSAINILMYVSEKKDSIFRHNHVIITTPKHMTKSVSKMQNYCLKRSGTP